MWRITTVAGLVALMAIAVLSTETTSVHACSVGPDFDPIAESTIVVGGRFLSYEVVDTRLNGEGVSEQGKSQGGFSTVRVEMAVETIYKGAPEAATISLIDSSSLLVFDHEPVHVWSGSSGSCGAFSSNPTGQYAIVGLQKNDDGTYRPGLPLNFFFGREPAGPNYEGALKRMASYPGAASLPALGTGPASAGTTNHLVAAITALGVALLAASFAIRFGTRRKI